MSDFKGDKARGDQLSPEKISPMLGPITEKFLEQISKYKLQFTCEECANFVEETGQCLYEYPTLPHRRSYLTTPIEEHKLIFCREFELL